MQNNKVLVTSSQLEFLAEDILIQIIPEFSSEPISLICGTFGPFRPSYPCEVPLWFALVLKQRKRCRVVAPAWLSLDELRHKVSEERLHSKEFQPVHDHYFELAHLLLRECADDIPSAEHVRQAVEDLWALRSTKARDAIATVVASAQTIKATNMSLLELNTWRANITISMDHFRTLSSPLESASSDQSSSFSFT